VESDVEHAIGALEAYESNAVEAECDDTAESSSHTDIKDSGVKEFDAMMAQKHGKDDILMENEPEVEAHEETNEDAADYIVGLINNPVNEENNCENIENVCETHEEIQQSMIEWVMSTHHISLLQFIKKRIAMCCEDCNIGVDDEEMSTMSSYLARDINALAEQYKYDD